MPTLISVGNFKWSPISNTLTPNTLNNFSSSSTAKNCISSTGGAAPFIGVFAPLGAGVLPSTPKYAGVPALGVPTAVVAWDAAFKALRANDCLTRSIANEFV